MAELRVADYKPVKGAVYQAARVSKGRKRYGEVRKFPDGTTQYWAFKEPTDLFAELNAWPIDLETLGAMRCRCVTHIGIWVKKTGDSYIAPFASFEEYGIKTAPVTTKGRAMPSQVCLPRNHFDVTWGSDKSRISYMMMPGR